MAEPLSFSAAMLARLTGPMNFRFLLQPLMALLLAFRDGRQDAREGRAPFFWALFTCPEHRSYLLRSSWKAIGKVALLAIILDLIFQYVVLHGIQLRGGALLMAVILAIIPYLLLRGPVNRVMRRSAKGDEPEQREEKDRWDVLKK